MARQAWLPLIQGPAGMQSDLDCTFLSLELMLLAHCHLLAVLLEMYHCGWRHAAGD
jgi:hypothetical protein